MWRISNRALALGSGMQALSMASGIPGLGGGMPVGGPAGPMPQPQGGGGGGASAKSGGPSQRKAQAPVREDQKIGMPALPMGGN